MLFKDKMKSNWPLVILSGNVTFVPIMSVSHERSPVHMHTHTVVQCLLCFVWAICKSSKDKMPGKKDSVFLATFLPQYFILQWQCAAWGENKTSVKFCPGPWVQVWISWSITKIQKRERRIEIRDKKKKKESEVLDVWVDIGHGGNRQKGLNERWARGETEQGQTERR